jgi:hypothetical protein
MEARTVTGIFPNSLPEKKLAVTCHTDCRLGRPVV